MYIDPNPLTSLDNEGHNYFLSQNPYTLNSYAGFGEAYYNVTPDLKLTGGLRWTDDQKHFVDIPSELLTAGYGYPIYGTVDQDWKEFTGRFAANWTPKLDFTDQTLLYASFAHGYKAGGANPPGAQLLVFGSAFYGDTQGVSTPIHPLTFKPEFINAYELGTKNTLLDGALTFNGSAFFYDYKGYQISRIVDRTAINDNFDATVKGAEIEATYEPTPGLRFKFAGGYEHTRIDNGQSSIDLMDRADVGESSRLDGGEAVGFAGLELHSAGLCRRSDPEITPGRSRERYVQHPRSVCERLPVQSRSGDRQSLQDRWPTGVPQRLCQQWVGYRGSG